METISHGDIITASMLNGIEESILRRAPSENAHRARQLPIFPVCQTPFRIFPYKGGVIVGPGRVYYYSNLFGTDENGNTYADFQIGFHDYEERSFETDYDFYSVVLESTPIPWSFKTIQAARDENGDLVYDEDGNVKSFTVLQNFYSANITGDLYIVPADSLDGPLSMSRILATVKNYTDIVYHVGNVVFLPAWSPGTCYVF